MERFFGALRRLACSREGFAAISFVMMLMPALGLIGLAVDYNIVARAKAELDVAADSAAMAGTVTAYQASVGHHSNPAAEGRTAALNNWASQAATRNYAAILPNDIQVDPNTFSTTVQYSATAPTTIGSMLFRTLGLRFSGVSQVALANSKYLDIYFLMDNSPSMGTAATQQDMLSFIEEQRSLFVQSNNPVTYKPAAATMPSVPISDLQGCIFACHEAPDNNDLYGLAECKSTTKPANCQKANLRIDEAKAAINDAIDYIAAQPVSGRIRVSVHSFSADMDWDRNPTTQAPFTAPSYPIGSNLAQAKAITSGIDLVYAQIFGQQLTNFGQSMQSFVPLIPPPLNGTNYTGNSQADSLKYVFIISDGVDERGGADVGANLFNTAGCQTLKNMGVNVSVVYTEYFPEGHPNANGSGFYQGPAYIQGWLENQDPNLMNVDNYSGWYFAELGPNSVRSIQNQIQPTLQSCASANDFVLADENPVTISAAMMQLLQQALVSTPEATFTR